jgi:hypothetical protein
VTLAHQDWWIPFFMATLSYHAPGMLVSTIFVPFGRGTHQTEQVALDLTVVLRLP